MTDQEPKIKLSPEELLRQTARNFNSMYEEAKQILSSEEDIDLYQLKLKERAILLTKLPKQMLELIKEGQSFPKEEMDYLNTWASLANNVIETNNSFGMSVLLTPWGSKKGEPNSLERLIERLYPTKEDN